MRLEPVDQLNGNRNFLAPPSAWDRSPVRASRSRAPFATKADVSSRIRCTASSSRKPVNRKLETRRSPLNQEELRLEPGRNCLDLGREVLSDLREMRIEDSNDCGRKLLEFV